eukprot:9131982-Pyramimonas_sp.AAC.1
MQHSNQHLLGRLQRDVQALHQPTRLARPGNDRRTRATRRSQPAQLPLRTRGVPSRAASGSR